MTSGDVTVGYKPALDILAKLVEQDPLIKTEPLRLRLAVATALTFERSVHSLAKRSNIIDGIAKYHSYVSWMEEDVLFAPFYKVSAWHLRYVMGSWQQTEELIWARENVVEDYKTADKIADVTHKMVKYKLYNDDGVSVHRGAAYYYYKPVTLQAIHEIGGVCGAVSKFAAGMAHAFGVPALPVAQPGHCAYMWYKDGAWRLGNDINGWDGTNTHSGIAYTWMRPASYFLLMDGAQANLAGYRLSEKMRIASKLVGGGDRFAILEEASTECPQNFDVWEDLENALNDPALETASVQDALKPTLAAFRGSSMTKISNIAPMKEITSTCNNDQTSKITDDGSDSQWVCRKQEATFEIDLATPCTINKIKFKWWGWSKAGIYTISALSESGNWTIVKTQDDETVNGWFNHWSTLGGWDMRTTKIRVEMSKGKKDPWSGTVWLGIRQFRVMGVEHSVPRLISTGKSTTANPESTGVEGLVDDDNTTVWNGNSEKSWFEIDLKTICALENIELDWADGATPQNLQVRCFII